MRRSTRTAEPRGPRWMVLRKPPADRLLDMYGRRYVSHRHLLLLADSTLPRLGTPRRPARHTEYSVPRRRDEWQRLHWGAPVFGAMLWLVLIAPCSWVLRGRWSREWIWADAVLQYSCAESGTDHCLVLAWQTNATNDPIVSVPAARLVENSVVALLEVLKAFKS